MLIDGLSPASATTLHWREWLARHFASYITAPNAPRHDRFWEWVSTLEPGVKPHARVEVWPRGGGKALDLNTPLPTPDGWTTMGAVDIGTVLLDHRGMPTTIMAMSAIETKPCYRVIFDDGSELIASDDHLWSVLDRLSRHTMPEGVDWANEQWDATDGRPLCSMPGCEAPTRKGTLCSAHAERRRLGKSMTVKYRRVEAQGAPRKAQVLTTAQLLEAGLRDGRERRWAIPVAGAFDGADVELPVHPYVLGAWLGDGTTTKAAITCGDEDVDAMQTNLEACGIEVRRLARTSGYSLSLVNGTRVALREAGVLGHKHIPSVYLRASRQQRLALLQGLLDTDGYATARGRAAEFVTTKPALVGGVQELAHSLGYRVTVVQATARLNGRDCGPMWRLRIAGITPDVFALPRKVQAAESHGIKAQRNTGRLRYIEAIERVEDRPVRCIVVDSPGHLFLAGESWIPTHNSSTVELGCAYVGSMPIPRRNFVLYVSETQAQADKHVQAIANMLLRAGSRPAKNRLGASQGWRREQVRTANGFNIAAFGLDSGMRGARLDEFRPDLIVFDDVDGRHDTAATVQKKIDIITETVLPSGSVDCAVIIVQNKIHKDSIVSRLCDGRADFLHDRIPATVEPAVNDLTYERVKQDDGTMRYAITGGTASWEGQDLETCERQINEWGLGAFLREAQHHVASVEGGLWKRDRDIIPFRAPTIPDLERIVVSIDPNTTEGNDEAGIVAAGIAHQVYDSDLGTFRWTEDAHGYVIDDYTVGGGPKRWAEAGVTAYRSLRADALIAEKNNGGDMVSVTIDTIPGAPPVTLVWASRGKLTRAEPVQKLYEDGRIHHVGEFPELEAEMCTWKPPMPSPNRMDALVWAFTDLMLDGDGDLSALHDYMNRQLGRR